MDVLSVLAKLNPMARAKVESLVDKINAKREEKDMEPLSLDDRSITKAREEHANEERVMVDVKKEIKIVEL